MLGVKEQHIICNGIFCGTGIESVIVSSTVKQIESYAFNDCKRLRNVEFREGSKLEELGFRCFASSDVREIVIPKNVRAIAYGAFKECRSLRRVIF